jgi:hypothetical protein
MDRIIAFFTNNWQQKTISFVIALIIWLFLWNSLTETKTLPNVPIRVINLPEDKTIVGMMPNGILNRRLNLSLNGSKRTIDELEPGDIEVLVDASTFENDEQLLAITRKNLLSLNPNLNVTSTIDEVKHPEFIIKLSKIVSRKVPITILPPEGIVPDGYEYLDIWPQKLTQIMTGPEEQVEALAVKGIELKLDFSEISKADLDRIKTSRENFHDDEVSFFIPARLKKITVPFRNNTLEEINDPEAQNLHIDFMRKEALPLATELPVRLFYPLETSALYNPGTLTLSTKRSIKLRDGLTYLPMQFYLKDVSRHFIEVVKDFLVITVVASKEKPELAWGLSIIAPHELENRYVATLISQNSDSKSTEPRHSRKREDHLRARFRRFLQHLTLYSAPDKIFDLVATIENNEVVVKVQHFSLDAAR